MAPGLTWIVVAFCYLTDSTGFINAELHTETAGNEQPKGRPVLQGTAKPQRLIHSVHSTTEIKHDRLDTKIRNSNIAAHFIHLAHASFQVDVFGSSFILDLDLNHDLLSAHYIERHFNEAGNTTQTLGVEHCYYHGEIRGLSNSFVAMSTCHGLNGVFYDGNYTYVIELTDNKTDQHDRQSHIVYRSPGLDIPVGCASSGCFTDDNTWQEFPDKVLKRRTKRQIRRGQRSVLRETKYIELMVVNDHTLFSKKRYSVSLTSNFAKSVVNFADAIYKEQLNTRIVLVAMETWATGDKMDINEDPMVTLRDFMEYRRDHVGDHSDAFHMFSGRIFQSSHSATAYVGGICSLSKGGGINENGNIAAMGVALAQSLGQNLGMMWSTQQAGPNNCRCPDVWRGCIMEDTGHYLPRKFSRCSISDYNQLLQAGGGTCLFNKPLKLVDPQECGNGYVENGEECDCGSAAECSRAGGNCCKKCTLTHYAMCSNGLCCRGCQYEPRGEICRQSVNECDIAETCSGDSSQCPWNVHKLDGYSCDNDQGHCLGNKCQTRDRQCNYIWGHDSADRLCYEKLNVEGTEKGNCGKDGQNWLQCSKQDVLCGYLFCSNITQPPRHGTLIGDITSMVFYHQSKYLDCRGGHVELDDGTRLGYVEDGTACGPDMMCLDHKCLPVQAFNLSSCPQSANGEICFNHGVCSNEAQCICVRDWTGKDCSVFDPFPDPTPAEVKEGQYKGPSGTNIIIGSIAGGILVAAIVLGGTGWGFKNIRRGRYDAAQQGAI
ncbi:disintegrin and metalloproteinase domain-containing protein 11 isoform X1 [Amblyraja radiata]|uniref:disintegrin and metalloproteinase domain-containing protein 11 isoform X1 n=1 Tax=Amblyraja radiata TaxID=386614 RepID=UPI001401D399|nr:disintegrin and metalloproteinase domain-containing protein 11 isoform X1 [Amblyraja radiata]